MRNKNNGQFMKRSRLYRIDLREKQKYENLKYNNFWMGVIVLEVLAILMVFGYLKSHKNTLPQALQTPIEVNAVEDTTQRYCDDPKAYLRCKAQDLGIDDYTTSKIIRMIGECENGSWNPESINVNNDKHKSIDVGIMMINMYWHRNEVKLSDMLDYKKNIDFGLKMFQDQGFTPWVCARKLGFIK